MKILFIDSNTQHMELFVESGLFQCKQATSLNALTTFDGQAVFVSEESVQLNALIEKLGENKSFRYMFYLFKNTSEEQERLCHKNRIIPLVYPEPKKNFETVRKIVYPDNASNRVFLFYGADRKAGTTSVVHAVAHQLSTISTKKILVVSLTGRPNDTFFEFSKSTIDNLRNSIASRVVTFSEILKESEKIQNYQFLPGPRDVVRAQLYEFEDICYFLEVLRKQDDYLVLIDGGGDLYTMLTTAALKEVNNRFVVIKNRESYSKMFDDSINQILSVHPLLNLNYESFQYIFTECGESEGPIEKLKDLDYSIIGEIPKSYYGETAENTYNAIHNLDNGYRHSVVPIAELIASKSGTRNESTEERSSFLQRIFKSKLQSGVTHA